MNNCYDLGMLKIAAEGQTEKWSIKRYFLSLQFTVNWRNIA
ncbi:DUF4113 domain-containing protein [Colwellia sp. MB02u-9]